MNFTVLTAANNHAMDYGPQGMRDTVEEFSKQNLELVGAGLTLKEAEQNISYQDVNGIKIATLGFTDVSGKGFAAKRNAPGVLPADPELFIPMISKAKRKPILSLFKHTGDRNTIMIRMTDSANWQEQCQMPERILSSDTIRTCWNRSKCTTAPLFSTAWATSYSTRGGQERETRRLFNIICRKTARDALKSRR